MIGGNTALELQLNMATKDAIGAAVKTWTTAQTLFGWLDFLSGEARYSSFNAKIQESSHVFLCDYVPLAAGVKAEKARAVVNGEVYDVTLIDNPMNKNRQLEIYLKYTGGQNG